jgi:DNA-binding transcriptional regulator GbsR (MarR family)
MDADRLAPHVRRVVDAAETIDERLLVLLFFRKAEPAPELAELLGAARPETTGALGRLSGAGLVSHHRPEGEATHWFTTPQGKAKAEQLHRAISARLTAEPVPTESAPPPAEDPAEPDHGRVRARRRVAIDQNEKTGFSWD